MTTAGTASPVTDRWAVLGDEICAAVIEGFPVSRVEIRLRKLNLPFPNNLSHVEVSLARDAPLI